MSFKTYQTHVAVWIKACLGPLIAADVTERNHRFLEEALELVQSKGCTASEAHQLVDYVFNRPVGEPFQELGGVMVTLAALANAADLNMDIAAETELVRAWEIIDKIRAKAAAKPKFSPLPQIIPITDPYWDVPDDVPGLKWTAYQNADGTTRTYKKQ
jgi:hypothetical protein